METMKWAWLSLLSGLLGLLIFFATFQMFGSSWIAHAVAAGLAGIAAMLALRRATTASGTFVKAVNAGLAIGLSLGIVLSIQSWSTVIEQAKATAGNKPFCIQVADNGQASYRSAGALLDLSGLTLRSQSQVLHHAILVVGDGEDPQLYHWSYRKQEFVPGALNQRAGRGPSITCIPRRDFAEALPVLFPQTSADRYVRFSGQDTFLIPAAYQPRWSGAVNGSLLIVAPAPDFAPLNTSWDRLSALERDSNWVFVQWNPDWFLSLIASNDGQVIEQGTVFGLQKQLIVWRGRDSKDYESHRYIVPADRADSGANPTQIRCAPSSQQMPKSCQHRFLHGRRHYYFRHQPDHMPRWQEMQKKVLDLFASFEARSAAQAQR
jgi:hypothetical protein